MRLRALLVGWKRFCFERVGVSWKMRRFSAQVAEWLKAADCKSAAPRATEVRILPCAPVEACRVLVSQEVTLAAKALGA